MKDKTLKLVFFLVVFGIPVGWYLFLQVFGENKFELDVIRKIDASCVLSENQFILVKKSEFNISEVNQFQRLTDFINLQHLTLNRDSVCFDSLSQNTLLLVDRDQQLRGIYDLSILEIDRAIVELDLLQTLQTEDE